MTNKPLRNPVPLSAQIKMGKAMSGVDTGVKLTNAERLFIMKDAYNHLENAAYHEAERVDKLENLLKKARSWINERRELAELVQEILDIDCYFAETKKVKERI